MPWYLKISIIMVLIAIALYIPPLFLFILLLASTKVGFIPAIIYMYVIGGVYWWKNRGEKK
jgi:ABC-type dipeptide/oligopeptide/nickel transport system permease subunit